MTALPQPRPDQGNCGHPQDKPRGGVPFCCACDGAISFDPGALPEPSSWALLVSSLGLAGAVMHRRRIATAS
jgi:hypothetical protein